MQLNARGLAARWNCKRLDTGVIQISRLPALQKNHVTLAPTLRVGAFVFVLNVRRIAGGCSAGTVVGIGRSIAADFLFDVLDPVPKTPSLRDRLHLSSS